MTTFSLIETLERLVVDPLPTFKFRAIVKHLKNLKLIIEHSNEAPFCCLPELLSQLTIPIPDEIKDTKTFLVPSEEVHNLLVLLQVPERVDYLLVGLFGFILIKLQRSLSEDAAAIMHDFLELEGCIFSFRSNGWWMPYKMDELVLMFTEKLVKMVWGFTVENFDMKFDVFGVVRKMLLDIGQHPAYAAGVVRQIIQELILYYEHTENVDPSKVDDYVFENYLTYLYVVKGVIGAMGNAKDDVRLLVDLRTVLSRTGDKFSGEEIFLVQNILRDIEVNLTV